MKSRTCYICATKSREVEGRIPLCDWCAKAWSLRTELRTETVTPTANAWDSFNLIELGN